MKDDLVTVGAYANPQDAHMLRIQLESHDIPAYIEDEHILQMNWLYGAAVGGVKVKVAASDVARAREVVKRLREGENRFELGREASWGTCPMCGSAKVDVLLRRRMPLVVGIVLALGLHLPGIPKRRLKCEDCGHTWKYRS